MGEPFRRSGTAMRLVAPGAAISVQRKPSPAEKQRGFDLSNAEVVRNPYNVSFMHAQNMANSVAERGIAPSVCWRIGSGREGYHILFEATASPSGKPRLGLSLYGEGPIRDPPREELCVRSRDMKSRDFGGHVASVERHLDCQPRARSTPLRYEGMPLAMVEAMLCGCRWRY